jgi:hypothetical protein
MDDWRAPDKLIQLEFLHTWNLDRTSSNWNFSSSYNKIDHDNNIMMSMILPTSLLLLFIIPNKGLGHRIDLLCNIHQSSIRKRSNVF